MGWEATFAIEVCSSIASVGLHFVASVPRAGFKEAGVG